MSEQLKAYQVGEYDVVAAYTPEQAITVLCEFNGYPDDEFSLSDVELVGEQLLDSMEAFNQDEGKMEIQETSLRQDVAAMTEPGYVYGWE